jgi:hypothetical protein
MDHKIASVVYPKNSYVLHISSIKYKHLLIYIPRDLLYYLVQSSDTMPHWDTPVVFEMNEALF